MQTLQELITTIRALRKELGVPEKESAPIRIHAAARVLDPLEFSQDILARLARVEAIHVSAEPLTGTNARSTASFDVAVLYEKQDRRRRRARAPHQRPRQATTSRSPPTKPASPTRSSPPKPPPTSSKACANKPPNSSPSATKPAAALDALRAGVALTRCPPSDVESSHGLEIPPHHRPPRSRAARGQGRQRHHHRPHHRSCPARHCHHRRQAALRGRRHRLHLRLPHPLRQPQTLRPLRGRLPPGDLRRRARKKRPGHRRHPRQRRSASSPPSASSSTSCSA